MEVVNEVRNIEIEIEILEIRLDQLVRELYGIEKMRDTHKISVDKYFDQVQKLEKAIESCEAMIEDKEQAKAEMIEKLGELEGIERAIAIKNKVEGIKLKDIAEEMGLSYIYVRKISARASAKLGGSKSQ